MARVLEGPSGSPGVGGGEWRGKPAGRRPERVTAGKQAQRGGPGCSCTASGEEGLGGS